jgi:hypothetical protein
MKFEDFATEKGLRLIAKQDNLIIEIGQHFTASEGDFYIDIYKEGEGRFILLPDFQAIIDYVSKNFGENNLKEFKEKADKLHKEMFQPPYGRYVKEWKKRK